MLEVEAKENSNRITGGEKTYPSQKGRSEWQSRRTIKERKQPSAERTGYLPTLLGNRSFRWLKLQSLNNNFQTSRSSISIAFKLFNLWSIYLLRLLGGRQSAQLPSLSNLQTSRSSISIKGDPSRGSIMLPLDMIGIKNIIKTETQQFFC